MTYSLPPLDSEWLEADGLGGFASGTVSGNHLESTEELYVMTRRTELARREAFESPKLIKH